MNCLSVFKAYDNDFIEVYLVKSSPKIKIINISTTSHDYPFFLVVEILKIYSQEHSVTR